MTAPATGRTGQVNLNVDWTIQQLRNEANDADRRDESASAARFRALANKLGAWKYRQNRARGTV